METIKLKNAYATEGLKYIPETGCLRQGYENRFGVYQGSDAVFADMRLVQNMLYREMDNRDVMFFISGRNISVHRESNLDSPELNFPCGVIHQIDDPGEFSSSSLYPGFSWTEGGNLLYTSPRYIGKCIFGKVISTETVEIYDSEGRNLLLQGIATGDILYNFDTGATATITNVVDGNATKDKIEYSAGWSDAGTIGAGDYWLVFKDSQFDFGTASEERQFFDQPTARNWSHTIINFYGTYYVLNGNYLATLNSDETTFDNDAVAFPGYFQGVDMAYNQDKILIGGDILGRGMLLLWTEGLGPDSFLSTISMNKTISSVKTYGSGWLVYSGDKIYYTDGYTLQKITEIPDNVDSTVGISPNGMYIQNETIYIGKRGYYNRNKTGVHIYDIENNSWAFSRYTDYNGMEQGYNTSAGCVMSSYNSIFTSAKIGSDYTVDELKIYDTRLSEAIFYVKSDKMMLNNVDINLGIGMGEYYDYVNNSKIIVAIGDCDRPLFSNGSVEDDALSKSVFEYVEWNGSRVEKGNLIKFVYGKNGGEIAFVESVNGKEVTLDRDLTNNIDGIDRFIIMPFKKMGEKDMTDRDIKNPFHFNKGMQMSGDFFIYIHIQNDGLIPLEIKNVFYG